MTSNEQYLNEVLGPLLYDLKYTRVSATDYELVYSNEQTILKFRYGYFYKDYGELCLEALLIEFKPSGLLVNFEDLARYELTCLNYNSTEIGELLGDKSVSYDINVYKNLIEKFVFRYLTQSDESFEIGLKEYIVSLRRIRY